MMSIWEKSNTFSAEICNVTFDSAPQRQEKEPCQALKYQQP